ncbi:uncharacterized protein LOC113516089 [Galleria mellonella]|uniref:Uncharacterized protein LOC113516089 n=1 Tax=Galleria mellonella TaxID=7137 RepID=A0A6J1WMN1_GALME|nr:uncharacterized protein LOC113516089 [Galleria mellonella]
MFESDDFDQILSQFDIDDIQRDDSVVKSESLIKSIASNIEVTHNAKVVSKNYPEKQKESVELISDTSINDNIKENLSLMSHKHSKRKIIDSHFDYKTKRKFPGPAGMLTGSLQVDKDESVSHIELLSQDIDYSQNNIKKEVFESPLWLRLVEDIRKWNLHDVDPIITIKQQAVAGNLRRRKAQTVTAFVECVDRSVIDPLIILRDTTGNIKCTLHRDAWSTFSPYIVSEHCALVLWKPTVLTTGSAFKKHYLNITLSNIYAIFSSAILQNDDEKSLPDGFVKVYEDLFTIIKIDKTPQNLDANFISKSGTTTNDDLFDGLDSVFLDEIF